MHGISQNKLRMGFLDGPGDVQRNEVLGHLGYEVVDRVRGENSGMLLRKTLGEIGQAFWVLR